ncbi:WGxxGxxG-CTERM domain-containing protein [Neobacillus mesonae]|nr:WGxxGxxG-CTERM domain-containing protein [Neobacillus mesonae]
MKKQWATMLAAASISMVIAVPAMADGNNANNNPVKNSVNRIEKDLGLDGTNNGTTNMNRTRTMNNMNDNMYNAPGTYNTNSYRNGTYGTNGTNGTYGTNNVRANAADNDGMDWGWLGLLGLFGLVGLRKERHEGSR